MRITNYGDLKWLVELMLETVCYKPWYYPEKTLHELTEEICELGWQVYKKENHLLDANWGLNPIWGQKYLEYLEQKRDKDDWKNNQLRGPQVAP